MHVSEFRVYYEDTDMAGVVYYANYLKFFERGRSDAVRAAGVDQQALLEEGLVFAVARIEVDYRTPARFGDILSVETRTLSVGGATLIMAQAAKVGDRVSAEAQVRIACMAPGGGVRRIPAALRSRLDACVTI